MAHSTDRPAIFAATQRAAFLLVVRWRHKSKMNRATRHPHTKTASLVQARQKDLKKKKLLGKQKKVIYIISHRQSLALRIYLCVAKTRQKTTRYRIFFLFFSLRSPLKARVDVELRRPHGGVNGSLRFVIDDGALHVSCGLGLRVVPRRQKRRPTCVCMENSTVSNNPIQF